MLDHIITKQKAKTGKREGRGETIHPGYSRCDLKLGGLQIGEDGHQQLVEELGLQIWRSSRRSGRRQLGPLTGARTGHGAHGLHGGAAELTGDRKGRPHVHVVSPPESTRGINPISTRHAQASKSTGAKRYCQVCKDCLSTCLLVL
jgi:hypothetical protein